MEFKFNEMHSTHEPSIFPLTMENVSIAPLEIVPGEKRKINDGR